MLAAMAAGLAFGSAFPVAAGSLAPVTNIFLRPIRCVVAPVLFGALVSAARSAAPRELGTLAAKSLVCFEICTAISWRTRSPRASSTRWRAETFLQIVVFTTLFAAACSSAGPSGAGVFAFAEALTAIAFEFTRYIMYLAPFAVFASMAGTMASGGRTALAASRSSRPRLGRRRSPSPRPCSESACGSRECRSGGLPARCVSPCFAFATTSSVAALPQTIAAMDRLGIPARVSGVVTPLSLSLNMTGSCIHLAMGALFAAQAAGISLTLAQHAAILLTLKLTSKGVAGIPRTNLVSLGGLFGMFGLPMKALPVLLRPR